MVSNEKPQSTKTRPRGRPKKKIDMDNFKKLCALQCTLKEIAGFFDCSEDTIENWCKSKFKCLFSEIYQSFSATGKISLRRNQFKMSENSPAMAIFLGKQFLGQKDNISEIREDDLKTEEQRLRNEKLKTEIEILQDQNKNNRDNGSNITFVFNRNQGDIDGD